MRPLALVSFIVTSRVPRFLQNYVSYSVSNIHASKLIQKESWISILYRQKYTGQKKENWKRCNVTPLPYTKTIPDELKMYMLIKE